jgi:hypothetical protein
MPEEVRVIPPLARTLGPPSDIADDGLTVHRRRSAVPDLADERFLIGRGFE